MIADLPGIARGKAVPASKWERMQKFHLPDSIFYQTITGEWVDRAAEGLSGQDAAIARLAIVLAKAPYRVTEKMANEILGEDRDEERFIRILAWCSFTGARRFAQLVAERP